MSDENKNESAETSGIDDAAGATGPAIDEQNSGQSGPNFTDGPDPLAGVKKNAADVMQSMEGKTVSMKTYVGTIIGVVVLMLLARCS